VNLEGKPLETPVQLEIDGKPASPDVPAPVGKHIIKIRGYSTGGRRGLSGAAPNEERFAGCTATAQAWPKVCADSVPGR
jgi:hypothetical protein